MISKRLKFAEQTELHCCKSSSVESKLGRSEAGADELTPPFAMESTEGSDQGQDVAVTPASAGTLTLSAPTETNPLFDALEVAGQDNWADPGLAGVSGQVNAADNACKPEFLVSRSSLAQ